MTNEMNIQIIASAFASKFDKTELIEMLFADSLIDIIDTLLDDDFEIIDEQFDDFDSMIDDFNSFDIETRRNAIRDEFIKILMN